MGAETAYQFLITCFALPETLGALQSLMPEDTEAECPVCMTM